MRQVLWIVAALNVGLAFIGDFDDLSVLNLLGAGFLVFTSIVMPND